MGTHYEECHHRFSIRYFIVSSQSLSYLLGSYVLNIEWMFIPIFSSVFHGFGGRMTVSDIELSPVNKVIQNTFKEQGYKIREPNGKNMFGKDQEHSMYQILESQT